MCTASWAARRGGFELCFNRDERRTRRPALPPARHETAAGSAWLGPLDGDALGTWIGVNGHGVAFGLLNGFAAHGDEPREEPPGGWTSRGHVIPHAADADDVQEALERTAALPLERYRPFQLLVVQPDGRAGLADWSGRALDLRSGARAPAPPLISSSFCSDAVRASRLDAWRRIGAVPPDGRERFHASHDPARGAHSVCMHRPDARTVSFTRVVVDEGAATMIYTPDAPCRGVPLPALRLERVAPSEP